jgi:hypothetical protein
MYVSSPPGPGPGVHRHLLDRGQNGAGGRGGVAGQQRQRIKGQMIHDVDREMQIVPLEIYLFTRCDQVAPGTRFPKVNSGCKKRHCQPWLPVLLIK